jgi:hemerythrin-like domain-containing protein
MTFVSQYQWILNDKVNVKKFYLDNISEFENYISNALDVNFKLMHVNETKLDYSAVKKTPELIEFVDRYIDGAIKTKKSIL